MFISCPQHFACWPRGGSRCRRKMAMSFGPCMPSDVSPPGCLGRLLVGPLHHAYSDDFLADAEALLQQTCKLFVRIYQSWYFLSFVHTY